MILSRRHGFLFVKARKVGGTSVEMALSTICGGDDIVTPITPVDEAARLGMGGVPRNYAASAEEEIAYVDAIRAATPDALAGIKPPAQLFRNHTPLAAIAEKADIAGLRVIGVVRSPYAIAVSWANHQIGFLDYRRTGARMDGGGDAIRATIDQALATGALAGRRLADLYRGPDGRVRIEALRHDRLDADFDRFIRSLGIDGTIALPCAKQGLALSARQSVEMLRAGQRARIAKVFEEDIALFGDGLP